MLKKLFASILGSDIYILVACFLAIGFLLMCWHYIRLIRRYIADWHNDGDLDFSKYMHGRLRVWYSLFVTMISIFPLLGMFGTVRGLLMMDFVAGNIEFMKHNFFSALTSTAWGIIFSIIFKMVYALVSNKIEICIEESEKMEREIGAY